MKLFSFILKTICIGSIVEIGILYSLVGMESHPENIAYVILFGITLMFACVVGFKYKLKWGKRA